MRSGPLAIGQDFGPRYHVVKLLGSGGMGVVYQAVDRELGEEIALKVLRAPARLAAAGSLAEMQRRFRAELLLARKVTHKHVIRIHDIGEIDGIKFISMPLVKGRDLSAVLASGPLPVDRAVRYARQIIAGLTAVHAAGVVHRDMKPSNIMIGSDDQVLLMDFGIARASAPAGQQRTIAGAVVGTTAYMAPEQARGEAVDQRTDVYSFGLVLYEMLCGIRDDMTIAELLARMKAAPPSARQRNAAVPADLDAIVMRCLKPAAGDRYQTSAEVAVALSGFSRSRRGAMPAFAWRNWMTRAAAAVLVLALLAGLVYWLRTPAASKVLARAGAVVTQSVDRLSALSPALLAREEKAAEVETEEAGVARPAATGKTVNAERARPRAEDARPEVKHDVPRSAHAQAPQVGTAAAAISRVNTMTVAARPQFEELPRPGRALPSIDHTVSRQSGEPNVAKAVPTLAPWSASRAPEPSPFVAPVQAASSVAHPASGSDNTPAAAQALRRGADTFANWLDRLWSGGRYARTDGYVEPFEEFQICHVPSR